MPTTRRRRRALADQLARGGCVAAREEADELIRSAGGDEEVLRCRVARRLNGEPLAWVTGSVAFAGIRIRVHRGVYVPRRETEALVQRAVLRLPPGGLAADMCTGSGAVAAGLRGARPDARIVATDIDPAACRCAADNGVEALLGHLADPIPDVLRGHFDVVVAVVPYVPTDQLVFLPRDVREHEPRRALDGGPGGTLLLTQAVLAGAGLLRGGGSLILELGGDQDQDLREVLASAGYSAPERIEDDDGDLRGIDAVLL